MKSRTEIFVIIQLLFQWGKEMGDEIYGTNTREQGKNSLKEAFPILFSTFLFKQIHIIPVKYGFILPRENMDNLCSQN